MEGAAPKIHLVDDDDDLRHALGQGLELEGLDVAIHDRADSVLDHLGREDYGVIITDIRMPGDDGMALLKKALAIDPTYPVILITGHGDVQLAVEAMRNGAYDFIEKPFPVSRLSTVIERALEKRRLVLENRTLRSELDQRHDLTQRLVGRSEGIIRLRGQINAVAETDADVLVVGETGGRQGGGRSRPARLRTAGERQFCRHQLCGAAGGYFRIGTVRSRIRCLYRVRRSNASASSNTPMAGTIFLDEIESMPLDLQAKLLRAIEQRSIERLGSNKTIPLDVRFVAATKFDLEKEGAKGTFRSDLYYRLNVITLAIPPLRARKDDIALLFFHLARDARAATAGKFRKSITIWKHSSLPMTARQCARIAQLRGTVRARNVARIFIRCRWRRWHGHGPFRPGWRLLKRPPSKPSSPAMAGL